MIINPTQLLACARSIPSADSLLIHIQMVRELLAEVLGLELNADIFDGAVLTAWTRGTIGGVTIDEIALTSAVEGAAHLNLSHLGRIELRKRVAVFNLALLNAYAGTLPEGTGRE